MGINPKAKTSVRGRDCISYPLAYFDPVYPSFPDPSSGVLPPLVWYEEGIYAHHTTVLDPVPDADNHTSKNV